MTGVPSPARKPYKKPRLTAHGALNDLTRSVGNRGRNDMIMSKIRTGL